VRWTFGQTAVLADVQRVLDQARGYDSDLDYIMAIETTLHGFNNHF
jgi:hypothetical protein